MTRNLVAVFEKSAAALQLTPQEKQILHQHITDQRAMLNLFEGKHALSAGKTAAALASFEKANEHLRTTKLAATIFLLRHLPGLMRRLFAARERLLEKRAGHQLTGIDKPRTPSSSELAPERPNSNVFTESH
jgi:hypothetical protein